MPRVAVGGALPGQNRLAADQCYAPGDLRIGATLGVLGRQLYIYDCDDATRKWYTVCGWGCGAGVAAGCKAVPLCMPPGCRQLRPRSCLPAALAGCCAMRGGPRRPRARLLAWAPACLPPQEHLGFAPELLAPIDVSEPAKVMPVPELPPARHGLGIGSPEDTLQNCLRLVPKPPKRDHYRWQTLVRRRQGRRRLRFLCRRRCPVQRLHRGRLPPGWHSHSPGSALLSCLPSCHPACLPAWSQDTVVLRYEAVLEPAEGRKLINIDRERRFVLSFFMSGAPAGPLPAACGWEARCIN